MLKCTILSSDTWNQIWQSLIIPALFTLTTLANHTLVPDVTSTTFKLLSTRSRTFLQGPLNYGTPFLMRPEQVLFLFVQGYSVKLLESEILTWLLILLCCFCCRGLLSAKFLFLKKHCIFRCWDWTLPTVSVTCSWRQVSAFHSIF